MTKTVRTPQFMLCAKCKHEWHIATLPIEPTRFARAIDHAICPMCGALPSNLRLLPLTRPGSRSEWEGQD